MHLHFTDEAINDLQRLREFLLLKGVARTQLIVEQLIQGIEALTENPSRGVLVNEAPNKSIRDLFINQYCVRYTSLSTAIVVLRIWRQKENERNL